LLFAVDSRLKYPPEERYCWFEGDDPTIREIEAFSRDSTLDLVRDEGRRPLIEARALPTSGTAIAAEKRKVLFFVSYAHDEESEAVELLRLLMTNFGASKKYDCEFWRDRQGILVGENWNNRIQNAVRTCDFGLLLISPAFLASKYIGAHELPGLVSDNKPLIPVLLLRVDFDRHDLKGLEHRQVFGLPTRLGHEAKSFGEIYRNKNQRDRFALELFKAIEQRLDASLAEQALSPRAPASGYTLEPDGDLFSTLARDQSELPFVRTRGAALGLREFERRDLGPELPNSRGVDALEFLEEWACDDQQPPFCAVLGEYGSGKTTTLKRLTRQMLEKRQEDSDLPLPIYVDLRLCYADPRHQALPTLEEILTEVIRRNWKGGRPPNLTAQEIVDMVQQRGALIIFDGLDEKVVHLTPDLARGFIRELWRVLPPFADGSKFTAAGSEQDVSAHVRRAKSASSAPRHAARHKKIEQGKRRGKMILSCRSTYFKDVWSQNAMLTGEDREGVRAEDYLACVLLPFDEDQIRAYLKAVLGNDERAGQALDLFASVHNLRELASRPYLLSLITSEIGELERRRAKGERFLGVILYETITTRWLNRDDGKHHFTHRHKRELMENLAAAMWRDGVREWPWTRVERWLDEFLSRRNEVASRYHGTPAEVLNEDFRTATFVLRPSESLESFRFAHTSLQEYFLACHLFRALENGTLDSWELELVPSVETLEFLGELLTLRGNSKHLQALASVLEGGRPNSGRLAFRYWLLAVEKSFPEPSASRTNLGGLDLEGWTIRGRAPGQPLNLAGADLSGARLDHAQLQDVNLSKANFRGASVRLAEFNHVDLQAACLLGADFTGATLRECDTRGVCGEDSIWWDTDFIRCDIRGARLPQNFSESGTFADCLTSGDGSSPHNLLAQLHAEPIVRDGHHSPVTSCAWSPDGGRLVSGSYDNTLRVWEAESGRCLLTLVGHQDLVTSCAWSPDGRRLVSGARGNLRVWEAESGRCLLTLEGHQSWVLSCAWSPDGRRLVTGSGDNTLRVWEAESGRCLLTLEGHQGRVSSCAWSPDGRRLVSGSWDNSLRVWEAESGRCLLTLEGHHDSVSSCAWSPDGRRLVSGSKDNTLRVWEAESGRCLLTLKGHQNSVSSCAWSPDGRRLVSGSDGETLRVWEAESGRCLLTLEGHQSWVSSCAWSPDGKRLVSGSGDNTLRVWEAESGRCLLTLEGHQNSVLSCAWSPDGSRLVSGSADSTLRVWEAEGGRCLLTLEGHHDWVSSCVWSPDGSRLVSGSWDNTLRVWEAESGVLVLVMALGPKGQAAALDPVGGRICWTSPGAWRFLGWRVRQPGPRSIRILPAEFFGPLPT